LANLYSFKSSNVASFQSHLMQIDDADCVPLNEN